MKSKYIFLGIFLSFSSALFAVENIKIGMTTALTGPASDLGRNMRAGIEIYFSAINKQGGVNGRLIELIVKDDGYEPEVAASNMRALIDQDEVLAVIGNVGTPTAIVTSAIAQEKKTLLFGAFSGGDVLRPTPANRYIINYRPSYNEETAEMIDGLLSAGIYPEEIAFFTQADSYGDTAYHGATEALIKFGFDQSVELTHGRYVRNTLNVENAVANILDGLKEPKVIIMAAGHKASAKFITLVKQEIPEIIFLSLSFVGSYALQEILGSIENKIIITQVVPSLDSGLPIVEEYLEVLNQFSSSLQPNPVSLEGFIVAKLFHQGLLNIKEKVTKESIIDGIESINGIDIGLGETIYYDALDHQAIHKLWLTCLCMGSIYQFDWKNLTKERPFSDER